MDWFYLLFQKLEHLLINVEQEPSRSMQEAVLPSMKALISDALMKHSDEDVKVSVASCISEITRITAPEPPYSDEYMKEYFYLTVAAFEKLSHVSGRCYTKAVSVLETVSKVRSCLIMLDLQLDELTVKMFQHFLKIIRSNHPHAVYLAMATIMTLIIDESYDISTDLLTALLASVKKANQSASLIASKLGEKVIINSAAKLKPYLKEAMQSESRAFDEYAPIVASLCRDEAPTLVCHHVNGSADHLVTKEQPSPNAASPGEVLHVVDIIPRPTTSNENASARNAENGVIDNSIKKPEHCSLIQHNGSAEVQENAYSEVKLEMEPETVPRKRGWKPNLSMNPEEGYLHCWIPTGRKGVKVPREKKCPSKKIDTRLGNPDSKELNLPSIHATELVRLTSETGGVAGASIPSPDQSLLGGIQHKRGRLKKYASNTNHDADPSSLQVSELSDSETEEKALTEHEISMRKQSERSNTEVKQHKRPRNMELAAKTARKTSQPSGDLLSNEKDNIVSGPKEKLLHQSTQIGRRSSEKDRLTIQRDTRKRNLVISVSNVNAARSRIKKTKSSLRVENYKEEIPANSINQKHTPRKEVRLETPNPKEQLTGRRIKVWWPMDKKFYGGIVQSYNPIRRKHTVLYDDGELEILKLRKERWELIGDDNLFDKVQKTDLPNSSFDRLQKKGEMKSEPAKQLKFSFKRSGGDTISKRKARTSGSESASEGKLPIKKPKIQSTTSDIRSERVTPLNASPSDDGNPESIPENESRYRDGSPGDAYESSDTATPEGDPMLNRKFTGQPSRSEQESEGRSVDSDETT
ncbi:sister chromatid cohesion protein PDS5 homolog D isoform X2 [Mercurialis annua]|uniref:sister chromatid cohesion protein PDS5 homolog D isoform X2 n=1 Tax=Mercurialis annua TaxID=3986 RepID=UPI00215F111F|nr:sister chromatid cohesion protein PDS5 homolog D isoform X2 [Mercurialis annua]